MQLQARMRFIAFTAEFVQREYDPLALKRAAAGVWNIRAEVARGAAVPDSFSTQAGADLQAILFNTPTLPLETLTNTGAVRIDFEQGRIFRDAFWKGYFGKDTLLGWEERVRDAVLGAGAQSAGQTFAGGSFWKRFEAPQGGVTKGYVVNYELSALPGMHEVRTVNYPDNHRRYFKQGDPVLLLNYTNDPYKMVYDTIKVIDADNAIGVMHLGTFPDGMEFATFVMARQNYPFENMSVPDAEALFADAHTAAPAADAIAGNWDGHLITIADPGYQSVESSKPRALPRQLSDGEWQDDGQMYGRRDRFLLRSGARVDAIVRREHPANEEVDAWRRAWEIRSISC